VRRIEISAAPLLFTRGHVAGRDVAGGGKKLFDGVENGTVVSLGTIGVAGLRVLVQRRTECLCPSVGCDGTAGDQCIRDA
jgi:hypothetical protein